VQLTLQARDWKSVVQGLQLKPLPMPLSLSHKPLPPIEGDPTTQWINALLGRIFLTSSESGQWIEFVEKLIQIKLSRAKRPSMLGPITVRRLNLGPQPPLFYNARLIRVTNEGEMVFIRI
jgi:hypothetical protein